MNKGELSYAPLTILRDPNSLQIFPPELRTVGHVHNLHYFGDFRDILKLCEVADRHILYHQLLQLQGLLELLLDIGFVIATGIWLPHRFLLSGLIRLDYGATACTHYYFIML